MILRKVTEYAGNYIYENDKLQFFSTPEGYVEPKNPDNLALGYDYIYQYKDHLGNIRLSYTDADNNGSIDSSSEIIEENNYYPMGLKHKGYNTNVSALGNSTAQKWKFQGVELEEALGLDLYEMDFRSYDPAIGRFTTVDPLAEERNWLTPYNFVQNNPISRIDPTGLLDDYGLDQNGNVSLLKETDDNFDRLYSVTANENGDLVKNGNGDVAINSEKGSVTVSKFEEGGSILSERSTSESETVQYSDGATSERKVSTAVSDNKNDVFNVFKFAADNTNVEFSVNKFSVLEGTANYQIGTFHMDDLSPGLRNTGTALGSLHSHPRQPTAKDRRESLFGDLDRGRSYLRKNGRNLPYQIYFPSNGSTSKIGMPKDPSSNGVTFKNGLSNFRF